jgi:hypothetical protein
LELTEALSSADGGQLMRKLLHTILQALIDAEAAEHIVAPTRMNAPMPVRRTATESPWPALHGRDVEFTSFATF